MQYDNSNKKFPVQERFIVHYKEPGFETFVEVFEDLSCKTYHTIYDVKATDKTLDELEAAAEEAAWDECIKKFYS